MAQRVHTSDEYDHYGGRADNGRMNIAKAVSENRIGKRGWLGNPYNLRDYGREEAIELFKRDLQILLEESPVLRAKLMCMHGDRIACSCAKHMDCHVDIIVNKINEYEWKKYE